MTTDIRIFRAYNWKENQKNFTDFAASHDNPSPIAHQIIAAYFDEDKDTYRVFAKSPIGNRVYMNLFSWDELSQFIYEYSC